MAISWDHTCRPGLTLVTPVEQQAVCSVGRWMSHDAWPGWQEPCTAPGDTCRFPPYVLCAQHDSDLAARVDAPSA